jgi:hypothetical protein
MATGRPMAKGTALRGTQDWIKDLGGSYSLPHGPTGFQLRIALLHLQRMEEQIAAHPQAADIRADIAAYWRAVSK